MSTILDALRKVEEDSRARSPNARARLLFAPARLYARLPQRRRASWLLSAGFVLVGFVAGTGLVLWGIPPRSVQEGEDTSRANPPEGMSLQSQWAQTPPGQPAPPTQDSPAIAAVPAAPPSALDWQSPSESLAPPLDAPVEADWLAEDSSAVQRSPFTNAAPVGPAVTPASKPTPSPAPAQTHAGTVFGSSVPSVATPVLTPSAAPASSSSVSADTSLSFLQWSPEPEKRIAFIKVKGGPLTLVHEGDTVAGFTVEEIRRDAVDLRSGNTRLTLRVQ